MLTVLIVSLISGILFCLQQQRKELKFLFWFIIALLFIFTVNNPDYKVYEAAFYTGWGPFHEAVGFEYLAKILKDIGLNNYKYFLLIISLLVLFVFHRWEKYTGNIHIVIYLYSLFIMYYDIIQIRNAIAAFLLVFSLLMVIQNKSLFWIFVSIVIAFCFHVMAVLPGVLVLYLYFVKPSKTYKISKKELLFFIFSGIVNIIYGRNIFSQIGTRYPVFEKINFYLTTQSDMYSFFIWTSSSLLMIFMLWEYGVKNILNSPASEEKKRAVNILFRFSLFSLVLSGMTIYMDEIVRIYRLFFLTMFFLYVVMRSELKSKNRRWIFQAMAAVNIIFMCVWMYRGIDIDSFW